jgi:anti-sigma regulatory factor (Ser/Thr protein kinase)
MHMHPDKRWGTVCVHVHLLHAFALDGVVMVAQAVADISADFHSTAALTAGVLGSGTGPRTETCLLRAHYTSVGLAREFVRRVAWRWHLEWLCEDLAAVVTELVTNALRHGLRLDTSASPRRLELPDGWDLARPLEVRLTVTGSRVTCAVHDPSSTLPVRRSPDPSTESGRGLQLIESLSTSWGSTTLVSGERPVGKSVWAVFAVDAAPAARYRSG